MNLNFIFFVGSIVHLMGKEGVSGVVGLLEEMLCRQEWETRHGGLLGLKYLLAVREDLHVCLLPRSYPHIYRGECVLSYVSVEDKLRFCHF